MCGFIANGGAGFLSRFPAPTLRGIMKGKMKKLFRLIGLFVMGIFVVACTDWHWYTGEFKFPDDGSDNSEKIVTDTPKQKGENDE